MQQRVSPDLAELIVAIQALSPTERRQLLRRLNASGLLDPEELLTDQHRLDVAPALGAGIEHWRATDSTGQIVDSAHGEKPSLDADGEGADEVIDAGDEAAETEETEAAAEAVPRPGDEADEYQSAVSGKIVVGAPSDVVEDDPYAMHPVPGQAPERPIVIIFDGGSKGNPGKGYGSYALRWPGQQEQIVQLQFGDRVTNNEAEYDTLIASLEATLGRLNDLGADAYSAQVRILGDSLLVINQVKGEWKCKEQRLQLRRDRARELLSEFGRWDLVHHDRSNSVRVLGH